MLRLTFSRTVQYIFGVLSKPRVRRYISLGVMFFSFAVLFLILFRDVDSLREYSNWADYLGACLIASLLYLIPLLLQLVVWSGLMARLGQLRSGWWDVEIFSYSHLLRRMPGVLWYIAGRTTMYHSYGVSANVPIIASGLEWLLLLVSAGLLVVVLGLAGTVGVPVLIILCLFGAVLLSFVLQIIFKLGTQLHLPGRLGGWISRMTTVTLPRKGHITGWLLLYSLAYVVGGWIILILLRQIDPGTQLDLVTTTRMWALTGGVGTLLSFLIPAGMGIRELTLVVVLSNSMPASGAVLLGILLRVIFIASDLVWGGMLLFLARTFGRSSTNFDIRSDLRDEH